MADAPADAARLDAPSSPSEVHRLPGLDLLRAIAVLWVMLFHSFLNEGPDEGFAWLCHYGWMGVDLFFVLSGYLIGSQVLGPLARGQRLSFGGFYLRRAFRILPAFLAVLAVYLLVPGFRESPGLEPAWKFLSFTLNLLIDYRQNQAFSHAWSLCVEEHFYLVFPLLAWWLMRRSSKTALFVAICTAVVLGGVALRAGVWLHDFKTEGPVGESARSWFAEDIYFPTWNRLDGLLAGVVLASLKTFRAQWWRRAQGYANAALLVGLGLLAVAMWLFRARTGLLANAIGWPVLAAGFALLVFAGASRASWIGRWSIPGVAWLAATSYSLYLVHKGVFHMVDESVGEQLAGHSLVALAVYGCAALAAAAVLHYGVEQPFLRLRDWLLDSKAKSSARGAEPVREPALGE
ncbi:Peptidoglycan/LPS O-acetylase OafA/YrhL, contains acyltransferase and SGNH-hydrolase domains [Lysobacter enzymogenes]|nr:Peptidoglycan/LPS O-acetylase OafA/YrhL, contains acyltransferase and SGNH-hydrolase domains [Lysobacter enzymogenes]